MGRASLLLFLFLTGCAACGSQYYTPADDYIPPPECNELVKVIDGETMWTPVPLPFSLTRNYEMRVQPPAGWMHFNGQMYLKRIDWGVSWVKRVDVWLEGVLVASYRADEWQVATGYDVAQHLEFDGVMLSAEVRLHVVGTKPIGKQYGDARLTLVACGPGADRLWIP